MSVVLMEKLDELHKLHMACVELDHGIYEQKRWILFEQTKFIYSYFTFTSIYSIDWGTSFLNEEVIEWTLRNDICNNCKDSNKISSKESEKIDGLLQFYFKHLEHKALYDFCNTTHNLIPRTIVDPLKDMKDIMVENSLMDKVKKFQDDFKLIYLKNCLEISSIDLKRKLFKDVLYFIYLIRNSIFHGTTFVTHMLNKGQQRRLSVYTAMLIATNELLFKIAEKELGWVRQGYTFTRKALDTDTFQNRFNVQVPDGCLYYPCCGGDLFVPVRLFKDSINEFHFADIGPIVLAHEEHKSRKYSKNIFPTNEYLSHTSHPVEELNSEQYKEMMIQLSSISDNIRIPSKTYIKRDTWDVKITKVVREINIFRHRMDALLTLESLNNIAVFYYCGDSLGEGGSGQWWLGSKIFNMVLEKLVDGGIIITDGSNPDPNLNRGDALSQLWDHPRKLRYNPLEYPVSFEYNGRLFSPIGLLRHRTRPTYSWKVEKIK